jgi:chitinase
MRRILSISLALCILFSLLAVNVASAAPARANRGAWAPNVSYVTGDTVTYNGQTYQCLQSHTSLTGWEPPNVPALWKSVGSSPTNTPTRTNTPAGSTNTPSRTPTRTNTPVGPTNTSTRTPTRTNTPVPATNTSTRTPTFTPTSGGGGSCSALPQYVAGTSYSAGQHVQNVNNEYVCNIAGWCSSSAAWAYAPGTGTYWTDAWSLVGACSGGVTNTPTKTNTPVGPTSTNTPVGPTFTPSVTPTQGGSSCAVQSIPSGKVLVGYWETWDGSATHPGMGHIPLSQVHANYNVINVAFPVILSDGTMVFEDGSAPGEDVPTPAEICAEKARGRRVLLSIGGAAAAIDLSQQSVAQRFIDTAVPILKAYNFDGIDIDIESGLVAGANYNSLSTSQANLIYIIDGILAQMPSNFMLTMAPETAYVTGGQIAYGGPWGAYLPIIGKYRDNGRLSYLNMQYYNGSMYGCPGGVATSYSAGTVEGFVEQTKCLNNGFTAGGVTFSLPYSKQVPGLPAQSGAGGGYMTPTLVTQAYNQVSSIKGLMTWSINWDGSKGWTFALNKPY